MRVGRVGMDGKVYMDKRGFYVPDEGVHGIQGPIGDVGPQGDRGLDLFPIHLNSLSFNCYLTFEEIANLPEDGKLSQHDLDFLRVGFPEAFGRIKSGFRQAYINKLADEAFENAISG